MKVSGIVIGAWWVAGLTLLSGADKDKTKPLELRESEPEAVRAAVDRVIARENELRRILQEYSPRIETYLQGYESASETGDEPTDDFYFLGRLDFATMELVSMLPPSGSIPPGLGNAMKRAFTFQHRMNTFVEASLVDYRGFSRQRYEFQFVRSEFLGDIRCLVFDLLPVRAAGTGQFKGRIWVEDRDYSVVRFKGVRLNPPRSYKYYHFDSWRQELRPGVWLPVYTYAEESDLRVRLWFNPKSKAIRFRSQTRFWGYEHGHIRNKEELTRILVDAPVPVRDESSTSADFSPLASKRRWEQEAESNVFERLEKAGFVAPAGESEKVLETVVNNLVVTNRLDNLPAIRCRVLLSLPLESFTVVNTIVLSRGLIDVLPDEATLAAVLAHELGHFVLGHRTDIMFAFTDRIMLSDEKLLEVFDFGRSAREEAAADAMALELLSKSPYKDGLGNIGLFMRSMAEKGPRLKRLLGAHLGNRLADGSHILRLAGTMQGAPQLQRKRLDQIAALPLGSRLRIDAWTGKVELLKTKPIAPASAQEKMPFLVTPLFYNLSRNPASEVSLAGGGSAGAQ